MNVMTKILDALAFANVGNQHEFNTQLRQLDLAPAVGQTQRQYGSFPAQSDTPSVAPGIGHAQGAL